MGGIVGGIIGAVGSIGGALIGASSAKKAAKAQTKAAEAQTELYRDIFEETKERQLPFIEAGQLANEALLFELGLGEAPVLSGGPEFRVGDMTFATREEAENALDVFQRDFRRAGSRERWDFLRDRFDPYGVDVEDISSPAVRFGGFRETPDYTFGLGEGVRAIDASAAAEGGLTSGATLQRLNEFGQNFASLRRAEYLNRLGGLAGAGQGATNALASAGNAFAAGGSSALAGLGNARAAGAIAQGNAFASGLNNLASVVGSFDFGRGSAAPMTSPLPVPRPTLTF